jgi:hypothetical protein
MVLERWTVDQIVDDAVGVARARYLSQVDVEQAADLVAKVRQAELEEFSPDHWAPEAVSVFDRPEFMRQLAHRAGAAGLVAKAVAETDDPRSLFEGQVLWILTPTEMPQTREGHPIGPADTSWFFDGMAAQTVPSRGRTSLRRTAGADSAALASRGTGTVIDVTQAARMAMKRQYQQALAAPPE